MILALEDALPFNLCLLGTIESLRFVVTYPTDTKTTPRFLLHVPVTAFLGWSCYYLITKTTTGDPLGDMGIGSTILIESMIAFESMFITNFDTLQRKIDKGSITQKSFKEKFWWTVDRFTNPRRIGWDDEPSILPPRPPPSMGRWTFVASRLYLAARYFMLEKIMTAVNASLAGLTTPGKLLSQASWLNRALGVFSYAIGVSYMRLCLVHTIISIVVVGVGLSKPERWPRVMGRSVDGYTINRLWRRTWHQLFQKPLLSSATFVTTKILGFPPLNRTPSSVNYIHKKARTFLVFIIMGINHVGGEVMLSRRMSWGALKFFALQPLAMDIEELVFMIWTGMGFSVYPKRNPQPLRHNGHAEGNHAKPESLGATQQPQLGASDLENPQPHLWIRLVGYMWTIAFITYSLAPMVDPLVEIQWFTNPKVDLRQNTLKDIFLHLFNLKL